MITKIYPIGELQTYKYVVICSQYKGKILLSRHKMRTTWETQGGHIEKGETPLEAAKRELYEESGVTDYYIAPLCDYWAGDSEGTGANGMIFKAVIHKLGAIPESEMAEVKTFDSLPEKLTYPAITPELFRYLKENGKTLSVPIAKMLLKEAASCNPGQWEQHCKFTAEAAENFVHGKIENYLGKFDISKEKQKELVLLLQKTQFDDYDYLIQLCDAIAGADGIVSLEERMEDVKSRYGYYPQEMWDKTVELKRYFENKMQKNLYDISQPIGIAAYELTKVLREEFKSSLPKVEEIENELSE